MKRTRAIRDEPSESPIIPEEMATELAGKLVTFFDGKDPKHMDFVTAHELVLNFLRENNRFLTKPTSRTHRIINEQLGIGLYLPDADQRSISALTLQRRAQEVISRTKIEVIENITYMFNRTYWEPLEEFIVPDEIRNLDYRQTEFQDFVRSTPIQTTSDVYLARNTSQKVPALIVGQDEKTGLVVIIGRMQGDRVLFARIPWPNLGGINKFAKVHHIAPGNMAGYIVPVKVIHVSENPPKIFIKCEGWNYNT